MIGYLGEVRLESLEGTPYEGYGAQEWALEYIGRYGQIDGSHHKLWVLDQVARILMGAPVHVSLARWSNGETEHRFTTGKPPQRYTDWFYGYDKGTPP